MSDRKTRRFLCHRESRLRLEMNCSQLNGYFLDILPDLFPDAKFILTIRNCFEYLSSVIDHRLGRGGSKTWALMHEVRFGGFNHSPHERPLVERGLFPLDGYLAYWARHNKNALDRIPAERCLVIRTHEIGQSIPRIEQFLDIPAGSLNAAEAHAYPAVRRYRVIEELEPAFVEEKVRFHCEALMRKYFPEVSLSLCHDAGLRT